MSASCSICPDWRRLERLGGGVVPSLRLSGRLSWLRATMVLPVVRPSCCRSLDTWLTRS